MANLSQMVESFEADYRLGDTEMDETHRAFLVLCQQTEIAKGEAFAQLFERLFQHTREHFAAEEMRMAATAFSSLQEHRADHQRILGEMDRFTQRVKAGRSSMARAWLSDSLSRWFDLHARTMDSALAAHLKANT